MTHKTYLTILSIAIFCSIFTNCNNRNQNKLHQVDVLLEKDSLSSASTLFDKINFTEINTPKDSALYYLIDTYLKWQLDSDIISDDGIRYSLKYFSSTNDKVNQARALCWHGNVSFRLGNHSKGTNELKQAELICRTLDKPLLKYHIYRSLSRVNGYIPNFNEARKYAHKELSIAQRMKNNKRLAYTYLSFAAIFIEENRIDSSSYYLHKLMPIINYIDKDDQAYVWSCMGQCKKETDSEYAEKCMQKSIALNPRPRFYFNLASLYYDKKKYDQIDDLWNKALESDDPAVRLEILEKMHLFYCDKQNEHEAHQVAKRIIALKDSMAIIEQQDSIKEIQNMLEQEYVVQEAREERHMLIAICCGLIVTICIGIAIYTVRRRHYRKEISHHKNEALSNQEILRSLQQSSEQSAKDLKHLHKEMEMLRTEQSQLLAKGKQRYDEIMQGGNTALWHKQDFIAFMEYYRMTEPTFVEQQEKEYNTLSPKLQFFETLSHMGYSNKDIAQILCVGEDSLRSYKARVKKQKR